MDAADLQKHVKSAVRTVRAVREKLRKSPGLELLAAVAVGFVAGMVMRAVARED